MAKAPRKTARIRYMGGEIVYRYPDLTQSEFRRRLENFSNAAQDMTPVYDDLSVYFLGSIKRNFEAEGRPTKWAPLKAATIQERIRRGFGSGPILQRTKKLQQGFKITYGKKVFSITNKVIYFLAHQYCVVERNLPARVMVILLAQDKAYTTRRTRQHLGTGS